jgi:hypothetical protein
MAFSSFGTKHALFISLLNPGPPFLPDGILTGPADMPQPLPRGSSHYQLPTIASPSVWSVRYGLTGSSNEAKARLQKLVTMYLLLPWALLIYLSNLLRFSQVLGSPFDGA